MIGRVCVSVTKNFAKEPFRQKDGLKADIYATCRITFTFMSAVVLETAIYSAYVLLFVQYAVFFRVLPCVIAAPVYYAVFFRVRLLLRAYWRAAYLVVHINAYTVATVRRYLSVPAIINPIERQVPAGEKNVGQNKCYSP